jgi:uncharacterized membrane protein
MSFLAASVETPVAHSSGRHARIESIDVVRGVVMILMAIDHTRDFFGARGINPTDPATTTIPLFFTRWIAHFCAPAFCFLTGTAAFLAGRRRSKSELSHFLFTRGIWLIFLELVVTRDFGLQFNFDYRVTFLIVLWMLGWSMIILAALVHLPQKVIAILAIAMIAAHNLLDSLPWNYWLWSILHVPNVLLATPRFTLLESYPLIPWVAVTAAGHCLCQIYTWQPERRQRFLLRSGMGMTVLFLVLRAINIYGDPFPWSSRDQRLTPRFPF